ncbi:MAG: DegT/DnrJ/EryC1/StrS aminotransferase family protein, partial [Thermoproteota archaeon]|nr:DegT/DnrJ/EryC1/StrS aminotransferase family protein [Thermoproteota archaeon]
IEEETLGLNPELITEKVSTSTKAVIPMDYGGMSCNISEIQENAKNNNLILIEDGAESLGSSVGGKKVGSTSDATIFSFCGNKVLTTGEGGAVVTNSREIYDKIKLIRSHGRLDQNNHFNNPSTSQYLDLGYNWRMSSITAALGLAQLSKLEKIIKMRQNNAQYLSSKLSKFTQIKVPTPPNSYEHIYQMYTIRLSDRITRDSLHNFLTTRRIFSKVYFTPIHTTSFYQQKFMVDGNSLPITEKISQQVLTLPLYPNMTMEEKELLVQTISEFFESQ